MSEPADPTVHRCEHCGAESVRAAPPDRARPWRPARWLRRAAWLLIPAGALAWSCSPGFVAISLIGELDALAPEPGRSVAPEDQQQCRAGLERLDRALSVAAFWPPLRDVFAGYPLAYQRVELLECAGDVAGARRALRAEIARLEADLPAGAIDWARASEAELRAVQVTSYWRALASLEERAGDAAAALAAYQRQLAVSADLDGGTGWGEFTAGAASDLLRYQVRSGARDRARDLYQTSLGAADAAGASEETLLPLLEAYAELLEAEGNEREAEEIYARMGRLGSSAGGTALD